MIPFVKREQILCMSCLGVRLTEMAEKPVHQMTLRTLEEHTEKGS